MEGKRLRRREMKMTLGMEAKQTETPHLKWVGFRHWKVINAKLQVVTSVSDPLDTTVRVRYP